MPLRILVSLRAQAIENQTLPRQNWLNADHFKIWRAGWQLHHNLMT
jgi:hypothetical protein